jgi:hypothetical protein
VSSARSKTVDEDSHGLYQDLESYVWGQVEVLSLTGGSVQSSVEAISLPMMTISALLVDPDEGREVQSWTSRSRYSEAVATPWCRYVRSNPSVLFKLELGI